MPALLAFLIFVVTACSAPAPSGEARPVSRTGLTMGSQLRVQIFSADPAAAERAIAAVFAEFERLDALLSVWRPDSDVQRINRDAGGAAVAVSDDTIRVLEAAQEVSEWTGGGFDVTFGALADVWKFDHDQDNRVPTAPEIADRQRLVDYRAIQIDTRARTVRLARPHMRLHLGGIGKGYAVERSVAMLRERGFRDFIIQSGGDLYVGGFANGRPWRLGIADPRAPERSFGSVDLSDGTFSTSGDYERAFVKDGVRYHHLIDPATGMPARGTRSVTILANRPLLADGLSTGVFILGPSRGMALVERLPDVEAVIVTEQNEVLVSSGLRGRFIQTAPPTDGL